MGGVEDTDQLDEEGIVKKVKDCRTQAKSAQSEWRDESRDNYDMVAGKQWDEEDEAALKAQGRAAVVFNRLGTIIDAVSGSEVNNRQEVRYIPREIGDVAANEVLTSAAQWVRDNCDAEDEESDAFVDVLISGVGCTETRMDYEEDEEGQCVIDRVDPMEMRWDPSARKRNLADAKWVQRERGFTKDEIDSRWPGRSVDLKVSADALEDDEGSKYRDPIDGYKSGSTVAEKDTSPVYPVIQHQWYELETVYKVLDPTQGTIVDVPEDRYKAIAQIAMAQGMPLQSAKIKRRKFLQAFVCGDTLLEAGPAPCDHDFTFQFITGRRERNTGLWYGLVRPMRDPQRWANKFFSQLLHIINTNAKGGLLVEKGAVENMRKFEKDYAKAESVVSLNPGGLAKVQPKQPPIIPPAIAELMNFSISSIRDTSGVSLELLGMADREQAGYLEAQRTKAGLTILAGFFDALRLYRKRQGRVLAYFIQEYLSDGRLVKVVGQAGEQYIPLLKDPGMVKYDVVVDAAPTSRDTKEQTWQAIIAVMPYLERAGIPFPPEALEYSPVPTALSQAWKAQMLQMRQPNPMQQQQQALQMEQQAADVEKTLATADKEQSAATLNAVKAQVESLQPMIDQLQMILSAFAPAPGPGGAQPNQPPPGGFFPPNPGNPPTGIQ